MRRGGDTDRDRDRVGDRDREAGQRDRSIYAAKNKSQAVLACVRTRREEEENQSTGHFSVVVAARLSFERTAGPRAQREIGHDGGEQRDRGGVSIRKT